MAFLYFTCFSKTMRREWFGIDRLRLDKFLMLIRKFVAAQFTLLANNKW
jgi:ribosomal RNA-processing protein 1